MNPHFRFLQDRYDAQHTNIFVCVNNTCKLPVATVAEALAQLK